MKKKYYQLPLDPVEDQDIISYLDQLNRNTRPDFVKKAIRRKMSNVQESKILQTVDIAIRDSIANVLTRLESTPIPSKEEEFKNESQKKKPKKISL